MLSALWFRGPIRYRRIRLRWSIKKVDGVELNFRYRISPRKRKTRLTNCTQWAPRKEMKKRSPKIDEEPSVSGGTNWKRGETQKKGAKSIKSRVAMCELIYWRSFYFLFFFLVPNFTELFQRGAARNSGLCELFGFQFLWAAPSMQLKSRPFPIDDPRLLPSISFLTLRKTVQFPFGHFLKVHQSRARQKETR